MNDIDWGYACLSVLAALTLGAAVGFAVHWILGLMVCAAWVCIHTATEGFRVVPIVPDAIQTKPELFQ